MLRNTLIGLAATLMVSGALADQPSPEESLPEIFRAEEKALNDKINDLRGQEMSVSSDLDKAKKKTIKRIIMEVYGIQTKRKDSGDVVRGCWLLAVGLWLLAVGCWLLAFGF